MELENRSGQLKAQSRIASRQSMLRVGVREEAGPTPQEAEALAELAKYDEQVWNQAQGARKTEGLVFFE
jgi:hypothetical protein